METSWTSVFRTKRNVPNMRLYAGKPVRTTPDWFGVCSKSMGQGRAGTEEGRGVNTLSTEKHGFRPITGLLRHKNS